MKNKDFRKATARHSKKTKKKFTIAALIIFAIAMVVSLGIYFNLPSSRLKRALSAGDKHVENAEYEPAIESYKKALDIDKESVIAYSGMAGAYKSLGDNSSAKDILHEGWTVTGDSGLLEDYHEIVLAEIMDVVESGSADLYTAMDIVNALKEDSSQDEAVELLDKAYEGIFTGAYGYCPDALFRSDASTYSSEGGSAVFSYDQYESFIRDLMDIYKKSPTVALKKVILEYAAPGCASFTINLDNAWSYLLLIDEIQDKIGTDDGLASMKECLDNAKEVQELFADIFTQLDVGNVDELRAFVVSEGYLSLRDKFLHDEYTPQENTTYVPISREFMILSNKDGKWSYRFPDFEENPETKGVITVWGNFFEDNGIQRCAISYEPETVGDNYYPHTKYAVTYLKSYITSGGSTRVAQMNYRLETTIETSDGEFEETVVGDWGGPNEWTMDLDTIESRIKA